MARHKARIKRTTMKVPVPFRDYVRNRAKEAGVHSTVYLETIPALNIINGV